MTDILDSHVHAWGPDTPEHPWETEPIVEAVEVLPVETEYTAEVLLDDLDAAGVDEAVVVGLPVTHWLDNGTSRRSRGSTTGSTASRCWTPSPTAPPTSSGG